MNKSARKQCNVCWSATEKKNNKMKVPVDAWAFCNEVYSIAKLHNGGIMLKPWFHSQS